MDELKLDDNSRSLLSHLVEVCKDIAYGRKVLVNELFEMTKQGTYPAIVSDLAESFGMMLVKVEAREYSLEESIQELEALRERLERKGHNLARENIALKRSLSEKFSPGQILGKSKEMREILDMVEKIADTPVNVLITGETGTGKELIAKALHFNSSRRSGPYLAVNCSSIPETLFESEIFGIEKGVATGVERRTGKIEQANGGTLFLDEIGDMPLSSQAKILRVLEERQVQRVGSSSQIPVDIRIVAATNKNLKNEIAAGNFREDLFYRLNVVHILLPPLRARKDDIPLLLASYLKVYSAKLGRSRMRFSSSAMDLLYNYPWPGNIRELENEVERAVVLAYTDTITPDDLSQDLRNNSPGDILAVTRTSNLREIEVAQIRKVLGEVGNNKSEAARRLGLSREGLRKKMLKLGIGE